MIKIPTKGLLLDTCAWIWLVEGNPRLFKNSNLALNQIEEASKANSLYLSPISIWEVFIKAKKRKLLFNMPIYEWVIESIKRCKLIETEMSCSILYESTSIEGLHDDPADRILLATAKSRQLTLATGDSHLLNWCKKNHLSALNLKS